MNFFCGKDDAWKWKDYYDTRRKAGEWICRVIRGRELVTYVDFNTPVTFRPIRFREDGKIVVRMRYGY